MLQLQALAARRQRRFVRKTAETMATSQVIIFNADLPLSLSGIAEETGRLVAQSLLYPLEKSELVAWRENSYAVVPYKGSSNVLKSKVDQARASLLRATYFSDKFGIISAAAIGPADEQSLAAISEGLLAL